MQQARIQTHAFHPQGGAHLLQLRQATAVLAVGGNRQMRAAAQRIGNESASCIASIMARKRTGFSK